MHHDVKPQNIIVVGGVYKLIDFGLSRPPSKDLEMLTGYMISRWWRPLNCWPTTRCCTPANATCGH